ncbi:E3 ubiquitin-protein ligase RBBP6-like [Triplophysa rosa]|uniref:E3 ubiquitin-protein ligase RBBP6-like n=1 Tax=Triplophysa rosa TaxID=992332 RepID=UPI002545FFD0|nr:E3 ubiquitin-protein ligase RBBP6-like [Triplophysa rosa]
MISLIWSELTTKKPGTIGPHAILQHVNRSSLSLEQLFKTENLAEANASEEDKIKAVMFQSSRCYYSTNEALKLVGGLPPNYVCRICGIPGHHIRNCPKSRDSTFVGGKRIRRSAGIPVSFLMEVDDPNMKGVMLSSSGKHVIPIINAEVYASQKKDRPPFIPQNESSSLTSSEPRSSRTNLPSDAVINTHNTTQSNIQGVISRYLKYAPERMGGGGRKKAIKNV